MDTFSRLRAMTRKVKTTTTIALWICLVASLGLLTASFVVPPTGIIDPSVLRAASLIFGFAALFVIREAVMEGLGVKLTHGETTIEVKDLDGAPAPEQQADPSPKEYTSIVGEFHEN